MIDKEENTMKPHIYTLIHDTNSIGQDIHFKTEILAKWNKDNAKAMDAAKIPHSLPFVVVEYLKTYRKKLQDAIDLYYKKEQEQHKIRLDEKKYLTKSNTALTAENTSLKAENEVLKKQIEDLKVQAVLMLESVKNRKPNI